MAMKQLAKELEFGSKIQREEGNKETYEDKLNILTLNQE